MGAPSPNHWTIREFPVVTFNVIIFLYTYNFKNQDRAIYIICDQVICTCILFSNKWSENMILMIIKYTHLIIPNVLGAFVSPLFYLLL